ncbi:uncharacterized protein LOC122022877 [Zingiber officinale]|uniref:uncharacterized protein LOC122022877 n=1 Tax=Zingiber officinale TaxID=94328 RepID=UPI001C4BF20B|nr:uncharacterized protein LOC122022877 [Zingiber officinale]
MSALYFALVSLLSLALLALLSELLYLLHCRLRAPSTDPELGRSSPGRTRRAFLLLVAPCFKHRSRVEPAAADHAPPKPPLSSPNPAAEEEEEEQEFVRWQEMHLGPSRSLYNIAEEAEEGHDEDAEEEEKEDTPFATPCPSPEFYTPLPSPPRAAEAAAADEV